MTIVFACPACGKTVSAEAEPGEEVRCPLCDGDIKVPPPGMETAPLEVEPPSSGMAVGALVCGILGIITFIPVFSILGIILGVKAKNRATHQPQRYAGKATAIVSICAGVIGIGVSILVVLMTLDRAQELRLRTVCMAKQRGIGQAFYIYAQDAPFLFPMQGETRSENDGAFIAFDPVFRTQGPQSAAAPSPSADLWTLVRTFNTTPKGLICPSSGDLQDETQDVEAYFDFCSADNLSFSYQYQYDPDKAPLGPKSEPTFPVLADASPYIKGGVSTKIAEDRGSRTRGNSLNHTKREGQNVLYLDGHVQFEKGPDVGPAGNIPVDLKQARGRDNIYTAHKPGGFVDPGDAAPTLVGTRGTCNLGSKSDACLIP